MENQNVSAQLFAKHLPVDSHAYNYGCNDKLDNKSDHLFTCVDESKSADAIENAFQNQLDLSEHYKSPSIFNSIKTQYMDEAKLDNLDDDDDDLDDDDLDDDDLDDDDSEIGSKENLNYTKESFGPTGSTKLIYILILLLILLIILGFYFYLKN